MLDDFIALSIILTGESELNRELASAYLKRLGGDPEGGKLEALLTRFHEIEAEGGNLNDKINQRIMNDDNLGPLAQQIIVLWYLSALHTKDNLNNDRFDFPQDPAQYFSGLVWSVVRAHPPGLSGGYFGHWKYPPEN